MDKDKTALDEFFFRKKTRDKRYELLAWHCIFLDEGSECNPVEIINQMYFEKTDVTNHSVEEERGSLTALKGVDLFEFRDDLLDEEEIIKSIKTRPQEKVLLSFRKKTRNKDLENF